MGWRTYCCKHNKNVNARCLLFGSKEVWCKLAATSTVQREGRDTYAWTKTTRQPAPDAEGFVVFPVRRIYTYEYNTTIYRYRREGEEVLPFIMFRLPTKCRERVAESVATGTTRCNQAKHGTYYKTPTTPYSIDTRYFNAFPFLLIFGVCSTL